MNDDCNETLQKVLHYIENKMDLAWAGMETEENENNAFLKGGHEELQAIYDIIKRRETMERTKEFKIEDGKVVINEVVSEPKDSVEISRNAKGIVQFTVKVYRETVEDAKEVATVIFNELSRTYNNEE